MTRNIEEKLEARLGRLHARQRLGIEKDFENSLCGRPGKGLSFCHLENWYSLHSLIKNTLRITGFYRRGVRNTLDIKLKRNQIICKNLPKSFHGYTILHLSDLHVDMSEAAKHSMIEVVRNLDYDLCVLTGDYRKNTHGPFQQAIEGMRQVRLHLKGQVLAILGNHDSIKMVPELEEMGYQLLLNESIQINRNNETIYIAGIDDAHFYKVDNFEKAANDIPHDAFSIILSHTPETYRSAAHSGFDVMFCGHTHGGQICLPGGVPLTWDADCPRHLAKGEWTFHQMNGYTSVGAGTSIVNTRLNCPPEVTLHHLVTPL